MKLSISNIAWSIEEDEQIRLLLKQMNITGIEIAPTKIWRNPLECTSEDLSMFEQFWAKDDIYPVAMQSLLFGQNHLSLFPTPESRHEMMDYLSEIISLAGRLKIGSLVFGSPKNRLAGSLSKKEQFEIAVPFFNELGNIATQNNVMFCIEPNPEQYGCDFITNTEAGIELVKEVGNPGFRLHLDAGALILNGENVSSSIEKAAAYMSHFHISEPFLNLVGNGDKSKHTEIAKALKSSGYAHWVSIEMKNDSTSASVDNVKKALAYALEVYH